MKKKGYTTIEYKYSFWSTKDTTRVQEPEAFCLSDERGSHTLIGIFVCAANCSMQNNTPLLSVTNIQ